MHNFGKYEIDFKINVCKLMVTALPAYTLFHVYHVAIHGGIAKAKNFLNCNSVLWKSPETQNSACSYFKTINDLQEHCIKKNKKIKI